MGMYVDSGPLSEMRYLFNVVITFARVWIWLSSINTHRVT